LHSTQETQAGQMTKIFDEIRVFIKIYVFSVLKLQNELQQSEIYR